jgi:hypothetical protein
VLIDFGRDNQFNEAVSMAVSLLKEYCQATNIHEFLIE